MKGKNVFVDGLGTVEVDTSDIEIVYRGGADEMDSVAFFAELIEELGMNDDLDMDGPKFDQIMALQICYLDLIKTLKLNIEQIRSIHEQIIELNQAGNLQMVIFYLEMLRDLPAGTVVNDDILNRLLAMPKNNPQRGCKIALSTLLRLRPRSKEMVIWLIDLIEVAGAPMADIVMNYRDQFESSKLYGYFFVEVAKLASIDALQRFSDLLCHFKNSNEDIGCSVEPILTMIQTGQKIEAIMLISALEESYTAPNNLPKNSLDCN